MSLQVALAIALSAATPAEPLLCSGVKSKIEPDMQIREADLDRTAAVAAAEKLKGMIDHGELSGEFQFGALNQLKIIQGHVLLQKAKADALELGANSPESKDSTRALCSWLTKEGFWYD